MNLREGTRRLALLLGVAGAIAGGFASYILLQPALDQRARHNKFEQLANLGDVQKERKCRLLGYDSGCFRMKLPPGAALVEQPNDWQDVPTAPPAKVAKREAAPKKDDWSQYEVAPASAAPAKVYLDDNGNPVPSKFSSEAVTPLAKAIRPQIDPKTGERVVAAPTEPTPPNAPKPKYTIEDPPDPFAAIAEQPSPSDVPSKFSSEVVVTPLASEVNTGDVKTINWSPGKDYRVESIETQDGQTLYPTPAPSAWTYLLLALFPILGFFIPWGTIRAIGWVGAGFIQSSK